MNKTKSIESLTEHERFAFPDRLGSVYVVEGVGTIGNLTRVTYTLEGTSERYTFTKVRLTSVVGL